MARKQKFDGGTANTLARVVAKEFFEKCRLDPAVVASPFITTIVDAISLIIYCNLSVMILA